MKFRDVVLLIIGVTVFLGGSVPSLSWAERSLSEVRAAQNQEYSELRKIYDKKALEVVPRVKGKIDTSSPEYKSVMNEYMQKRSKISKKYSQLDPRGSAVESLLEDPKFKGKIQNTGSVPANVNADVDLKATSADSARDLADKWSAKKGGKKPLYYTVDNPSVPTTTPPDDFSKVIKVVNTDTDTTLWTPETPEIKKAKVRDSDAWTTSGGQKGTGNLEMSRDKRGYYLDNEKKFLHSDRPIGDTPGIHDEDLKTFSKSISKAGGDQGAMISKNNPEFYEQATKMQKYGDPVEAGIVNLGDSSEVRKQKLEKWKQTARNEMELSKKRSEELGNTSDKAREDLAQQMRDQGHDDVAERIENNRQKVADSNADAAAQNDRLRAERDEVFGTNTDTKIDNRDRSGTKTGVVDDDLGSVKGGSKKDGYEKINLQDVVIEGDPVEVQKAQDAFTKDGGIKRDPDKVKMVKGDPELADLADPDSTHVKKPSGDPEIAAEVKKSQANKSVSTDVADEIPLTNKSNIDVDFDSPADTKVAPGKKTAGVDADLTPGTKTTIKKPGADIDVPKSKKTTDVDATIDASAVVETAAQVFQSGTKAAGDAIDENRDLNTDDAIKVVKDMTPGVREYGMSKAALEQRRLEGLRRQEKIRQLESKDQLTLDEEIELNHLKHEEEQNPNTISGDVAAGVVGAEEHYQKRKEERKKAQGREGEADSFTKDGLPMAADMAIDGVNVVNPINQIGTPIVEGISEVSTWEERQAWASQKDTITKYLNSEATKIDKNSRKNTKLLSELVTNGDLSDPEVQKQIDALLAEIKQDSKRLDKLNASANEHLKEVDPDKLKYLRGLQTSLPDVGSLDDWRNQKTEEQRIANTCPEGTIKLSSENEPKKCATCAELESEFNSSRGEGYRTYSEGLLARAESCEWTKGAREKIRNTDAIADCDKRKPGSNPVFSGGTYECKCSPGVTANVADNSGQAQCVSCDELYGDFNVAMGANERDYAQLILELSAGCGWIAEGTKKLENYSNCPENTVRLSDDSNEVHCVPCEELYGDFNAALDQDDKGYAEMLLEASSNCGWVSAGQEKLHRARNCPENTVKLSDENDNIECVSCEVLYGEFNGALSGGDKEYAQSLAEFAPNCGWSKTANQRIKDAERCPGNTVKLSDGSGENQCVPCEELYGDFNAALSGGDRGYAQTLAELSSACGWSTQAWNTLNEPQSCPEGTVRLSDQSNQTECVPCATLYGDYTSAVNLGDTSYAESLVSLASVCGWSQSVAQQMYNANQQVELDQRCNQQTPGSHAVINGDRYNCHCDAGMLVLTGPNGSSCQSCEQVRGYINSALQSNDVNTARGLMAGAQSCGWYDQAVQVVAGLDKEQRNQNNQQMMNQLQNQLNAFLTNWDDRNGSDDIPPGYYDKKKPQPQNLPPKQPAKTTKNKKTKPPPKKQPPKKQPPKKQAPTKKKPAKKPQSWSFKPPDCPQNGPRNKTINTKTSRCTYDKYGMIKNAYRKQ